MDREFYESYEKLPFSQAEIEMFVNILDSDEFCWDVLCFIAKKHYGKSPTNIQQIVDNLQTERRVKVPITKNSYRFEKRKTLVNRKKAERTVEKLNYMSLVTYENMPPFKKLYLTIRGGQLLQAFDKRKNKKREDE